MVWFEKPFELNDFCRGVTCRRWILCANAWVHSRSEQRKTGPCPSRSPACPCCRCETSGLLHSWWSAPDTERLWSRMHMLGSPRRRGEHVKYLTWTSLCCRHSSSIFTYNKSTVDFLQNLLLVESHGLPFPLFYSLLLQLLAGVHLPCGSNLTGTHLGRKKQNVISSCIWRIILHRHQHKLHVLPLRIRPSPALGTVWTCLSWSVAWQNTDTAKSINRRSYSID